LDVGDAFVRAGEVGPELGIVADLRLKPGEVVEIRGDDLLAGWP
jgi:hypothetical protein